MELFLLIVFGLIIYHIVHGFKAAIRWSKQPRAMPASNRKGPSLERPSPPQPGDRTWNDPQLVAIRQRREASLRPPQRGKLGSFRPGFGTCIIEEETKPSRLNRMLGSMLEVHPPSHKGGVVLESVWTMVIVMVAIVVMAIKVFFRGLGGFFLPDSLLLDPPKPGSKPPTCGWAFVHDSGLVHREYKCYCDQVWAQFAGDPRRCKHWKKVLGCHCGQTPCPHERPRQIPGYGYPGWIDDC